MIKVLEKREHHIDILSMKNEDIEVVVSNYGCTIIKILTKDKAGHFGDVVLGYDDFSDYQTKDAYLGALVGRVANRIKDGKFTLNNKEYTLAINNGPNHIHGGIKGFSYQVFDYHILDDNSIEFHYLSKDGEEGYPGTLDLTVTYTLDYHTLKVVYQATSDQDTLINLTNHSYFNLSAKQDNVLKHQLLVKANQFACIDANGLPTGEILDVKNTPFDFTGQKTIDSQIHSDHEQLVIGKGFDHPFIFNSQENQVVLYDEKSGRQLTVSTTLPGAQIYTANYLDGRLGKYGHHYNQRDAVCIETQNMPDAIHLQENPTTLLKKGDVYKEMTSYTFEVIK